MKKVLMMIAIFTIGSFIFSGLIYWWFHNLYEWDHMYSKINPNYNPTARHICIDGTYGQSIGRGTCSWHGGQDFVKELDNQPFHYYHSKMPYWFAFSYGLLFWLPIAAITILIWRKLK